MAVALGVLLFLLGLLVTRRAMKPLSGTGFREARKAGSITPE